MQLLPDRPQQRGPFLHLLPRRPTMLLEAGLIPDAPTLQGRNSTGIHQSGRLGRRRRHATVMARSIWPSRWSSLKNLGMKASTVRLLTLPCIATTAGMPARASRGPSVASAPSSWPCTSPPSPALWQRPAQRGGDVGRARSRSTSSCPGSRWVWPVPSSSHSWASPARAAPWQTRKRMS